MGIGLAASSLLVMPWLARRKRQVGIALASGAPVAESTQTQLCTFLSGILLSGLVLNAALGWWWADPVAALAMLPIMVREGYAGLRGRSVCCDNGGTSPTHLTGLASPLG